MADESHRGSFAAPPDVLMQELPDEEIVFLNLATEEYSSLDSVGTAMYRALVDCGTVDAAHRRLQSEFDVEPQRLRQDLERLTEKLVRRGLLEHRDG